MRNFWDERYRAGGTSGAGSYGEYADYKAQIINDCIVKYGVKTISDFGCGDGNQISLIKGYVTYNGFDISPYVIEKCKKRFYKMPMVFYNDIIKLPEADLCLSLDVLYHIVDEKEYRFYLEQLFIKSNRAVLIFSSNHDRNNHDAKEYIYHRKFTDLVKINYNNFILVKEFENFLQTSAKFFLYERIV